MYAKMNNWTAQLRTLKYTFITLSFAGLWACGTAPRVTSKTSEAPVNPLGAALLNMQSKTLTAASVTFALFGGGDLDDDKALNKIVDRINQDGFGAKLPRSKRHRPFAVVAPVDGQLPVHLSALTKAAPSYAARIRSSTHVAFIRFLGPPVDESLHLTVVAQIVSALSKRADVIIDMSTQRAFDRKTWTAWTGQSDWLADQIKPDIQQNEDGSLTFYTRGMAKFGLPDVEWFGRSPKTARDDFKAFQDAVAQIRNEKSVAVGQLIGGRTLVECRRPAEAFERDCVGL